jgi:hypothetical protein
MPKIEIEWLSDSNDCDQCGGGYADGARVTLDGELLLELIPRASCFGSTDDWSEAAVHDAILRALGYEVSYPL